MKLFNLFLRCLTVPYFRVGNDVNFAFERFGDALYIYFEHSRGKNDWRINFDFPARAYKRMGKTVWLAHRGFLRSWRTAERYLRRYIMDETVKGITVVGYSHGAAIAALCHEYVWFNRPDLRRSLEGYGFGSPRVLFGIKNENILSRWEKFKVIRNIDDIVTHLPPKLFGFSHVGEIIKIGKRGSYSMINAHKPENILRELYNYECKEESLEELYSHPSPVFEPKKVNFLPIKGKSIIRGLSDPGSRSYRQPQNAVRLRNGRHFRF